MRKFIAARLYGKIKKKSDRDVLLQEIEETRALMKIAYFKLSESIEQELVESAILELRSLEIKHAYLLKKLKKEKMKK